MVIDPPGSQKEADVVVDSVGTLENAARVIARLHAGRKRLIFVDSRRHVEKLSELLRGLGVMTFLSHGSLSVSDGLPGAAPGHRTLGGAGDRHGRRELSRGVGGERPSVGLRPRGACVACRPHRQRGLCRVEPSQRGKTARWSGRPGFLGSELCQAMRELLLSDAVDPSWSRRAQAAFEGLRAEHAFLLEGQVLTSESSDELTWWTFAGGRANVLLARMIEAELGGRCVVRNTSLSWKLEPEPTRTALRGFLRGLHESGRPDANDAMRHARGAARGRLSKFEPCLPSSLIDRWMAELTVDVEGARSCLLRWQS